MGQVLDRRRLRAAFAAVRANRGEPGVDGVTVEAFGEEVEANLTTLITELRAKSYRPLPVRRVWSPKPDGRQRPLGIPDSRDRVVQQAVLQVLEPIFEADFSPHSHGFRPGRGPVTALRDLYGQVRGGHIYCVAVDIEQFFDEIPHEPLIDAVAERVADGSVLRLVRLFLETLIQDGYRLVRLRDQPAVGQCLPGQSGPGSGHGRGPLRAVRGRSPVVQPEADGRATGPCPCHSGAGYPRAAAQCAEDEAGYDSSGGTSWAIG